MAVFGKIEEFDADNERWNDYAERIDQYFYANDIEDEKKQTAIFMTAIGSKTYGLLKSLIAPEKATSKTFKQLHEVLLKHLDPAKIEIAERYKFYERKQGKGESLKKYIAELRKLAETCNFAGFLTQALRDKYVCGIQDTSIRKRLLVEDNLTLEKALKISQGLETAKVESVGMEKREIKREEVFKVYSNKEGRNLRCYRCGKGQHLANVCRFKDVICNKCNTKGHIAKACRGGARKKVGNACNAVKSADSPKEEIRESKEAEDCTSGDENFDIQYFIFTN